MSGYDKLLNLPELNKRLLFTIGMLILFRAGIHIPTPGIDINVFKEIFNSSQSTVLGLFNMFTGGALKQLSILSLGIMPYISAAIIIELVSGVGMFPELARLKKEGEEGRAKTTEYTRYLTVGISILQGIGIAVGLEQTRGFGGAPVVIAPGLSFVLITVFTMTTATLFLMWMGEQVNERGIGNGISLIIFAGIVARMPSAIGNTFRLVSAGEVSVITLVIILALIVAVVYFVCYVELSQRRIQIQYPRRMVGNKLYGGQSSYLPIKINVSGVIPPIFASSILLFPATAVTMVHIKIFENITDYLQPGGAIYSVLYAIMIFFFAYFYTAIIFNPKDVAENLKKYGGFIAGIRPGKKTAAYIDSILDRLTFAGSIYLAIICVLPWIFIQHFNVPFFFGGTSLLIVVQVALDTIMQVESHLFMHDYKGMIKKARR